MDRWVNKKDKSELWRENEREIERDSISEMKSVERERAKKNKTHPRSRTHSL